MGGGRHRYDCRMRIAQVSGHYPPNFISGGTLVPQRIARAAATAGHESFVFAGRLDESLPALSTFEEGDGQGVSVTWLVTTPWTGWADERNFNNPEAVNVFSTWLREVQPDVVHVHSVQTLGGGVLKAAKQSGARVVLTMHDFWWYCSRQFLVDRGMLPCSLVVDCGECECQAGRAHRERRSRILGGDLEFADVVLAPSAAARDTFIANGLPESKSSTDENGLPDEQVDALLADRVRRTPGSTVRFLYAGGDQPMKGPDVLASALRTLNGLSGIEFDLYGMDEAQRSGLPAWARGLERFPPDRLGEVLDRHDVLVLPSIMRESHSILTREALAAGLAVICTDTLGPEEAVRHEYNGLVVPAADARSLADSIRRLAAEPGLVTSLMGKGSVTPIRRFSDQAAGLLNLYSRLVESGPDPAGGEEASIATATPSPDVRIRSVLFVVGIQGAPLRYRAHLPVEALALRGISARVIHYRDPELPRSALEVDAVVFYRVPATNQVMGVISSVRARAEGVPVLFDVDDLIFDPSMEGALDGLERLTPPENELWWRGVARYRTTMEACDMFVGSTRELCVQATATTGLPARRFPNGVGLLLARRSDRELRRPRREGPIRIGYFSGTTTHDADWAAVEPAVVAVLERHPGVELWLGGYLKPTPALDPFVDRIVRNPFSPWFELPGILRDTDICLAPLQADSRFNEAKSAIKWLEAALVETPTVASPSEPFKEAIEHGRTGLLAATTDEWIDALDRLLGSEAERRRIGSQARRDALLRWSPHRQGAVYERILVDAALHVRRNGARRATGWIPVMDDEPLSEFASAVDVYAVPDDSSQPHGLRARRHAAVVRVAGRAREIVAAEGAAGLLRRVVTRARTARAVLLARLRH